MMWKCCMVLGLFAAAVAAADLKDADVTDVVEREFIHDPGLDSNAISVKTLDGIVTLTGTVDNLLAKERATLVAETVRGVRSIVNRIEIEPPADRTDEQIRSDVKAALLADPATDSFEIQVAAADGTVTLTGNVESWQEKRLCATVSKSIKGVTGLVNSITVKPAMDRPDGEIQAEIEQALHWNDLVDDGLIDVAVKDGKVTLTGTVGSAAEKRQARFDAWCTGVSSVDTSGLDVERWARDPDLRRSKYVSRPAEAVARAVERAILQDPRVFAFNVGVSVTNGGTVTLRGTVDNLKAKRAAENVARHTVGAFAVRNHLKVRSSSERADKQIAQDIRASLMRDPYVDQYEIIVSVDDGRVSLLGTVDSYFERAQADDVASRVNGVTTVSNHLAVDGARYGYDPYVDTWTVYDYDWLLHDPVRLQTYRSDDEILSEVRDELWWSPFVDADQVTVTVDNGVATLVGAVDSWSEWRAAQENAYEGGAVLVRNDLTVRYAEAP
jgi:osmotically-inducible protein OsmY